MANNPTKVSLLDQTGKELFSVTDSHPESLNGKGSEKTRSIRIEGPANCVVTCFDDQQVDGYVSKLDGSTSDNNRVDNVSSIKFGA